MEGKLWKVAWKKTGARYRTWLIDDSKTAATATNLEEAVELLEDKIAEKYGDAIPHLEFDPAIKSDSLQQKYLFVVVGHNPIERISNLGQLFVNPPCRRCGNIAGARSAAPIELEEVPAGDLSFTKSSLINIASRQFVELTQMMKSSDFSLFPVRLNGKNTDEFFEVRSRVSRPFVAKRNTSASQSFRCNLCGFAMIVYMPHEAPFFQYISEDSLPKKEAMIFPIGCDWSMKIAVSKQLRNAMIRSRQIENVASRKVGLLRKHDSLSPENFFAGQ